MAQKGVYLLFMKLNSRRRIRVGKLGKLDFPPGFYIYVGRARNSLSSRVRRYFGSIKKKFWHIDYLLSYARPLFAVLIPSSDPKKKECFYVRKLSAWGKVVKNFGSSDCRCVGHLIHIPEGWTRRKWKRLRDNVYLGHIHLYWLRKNRPIFFHKISNLQIYSEQFPIDNRSIFM